jgi:carboxyl-terminal processing protease
MRRRFLALVLVCGTLFGSQAQQYLTPGEQKVDLVIMAIKQFYVDTVNEDHLVDNAINGMLSNLDPHSVYIPKSEVQEMNEPLDGNFEGIGVSFQMMNDTLMVIQTISGAPAEKVGIVAGDRIVAANDTIIAGVKKSSSDIQKLLRGKKGTVVVVKVVRPGVKKPLTFNITRDKIPIYSVDASYMVKPGIGYIKINRFSATTTDEYNEAFRKLKKQGMKSLIIDLQGNGGGYLNTATSLADEFLSAGKLVVYTKGVSQPKWQFRASATGAFELGNLVVLVDESSASASEILSGALQDWDRALIVGRRTFGKGLVQRPIPLPDGSQMRLTVARYYTPTGRCIQRSYQNGVEQYKHDLIDRYNRGELSNEDSVVFPDSLKYHTLRLKRTVYGGGGIMPDVFVPIDTTLYTDYHRNLVARGVINKFVLDYTDKNRKELEAQYDAKKEGSFDSYEKNFNMSESDLKDLIQMGEKEGVKLDSAQFAKSKDLISFQIKALIARDIWSMTEYFELMNQKSESYQKAVELLSSPNAYNAALHRNRK